MQCLLLSAISAYFGNVEIKRERENALHYFAALSNYSSLPMFHFFGKGGEQGSRGSSGVASTILQFTNNLDRRQKKLQSHKNC